MADAYGSGRPQCPVYGPAPLQPLVQRYGQQSALQRPVRQQPCLALPRQAVKVTPRVSRLLLRGRPPDVPRFIVAVIVDPVKRVPECRSGSYVSQECREVCLPAFANGDPPSTVVSPHLGSGVQAAVLHVLPRPVLGRTMPAVACDALLRQAATRLRVSAGQFGLLDDSDTPTGTLAAPQPLFRVRRTRFYDRQSVELLTNSEHEPSVCQVGRP